MFKNRSFIQDYTFFSTGWQTLSLRSSDGRVDSSNLFLGLPESNDFGRPVSYEQSISGQAGNMSGNNALAILKVVQG